VSDEPFGINKIIEVTEMMQAKKTIEMAAVIAFGCMVMVDAAFALCKPAHQMKTVVPGTLTVTTVMLPPYDVPGGEGGFSGVDGDMVKKIAEMECLKLDVKQVDVAAEIQYVVSGKADMTAGNWYATAERAKVLGLSSPLYLDQVGIFSKEGYVKFADLKGKTVGTVQGYLWVSDLQALYGDNLKLYATPVALGQDLATGRVDVGVDSPGAGIYAQKRGGYPGMKIKVADADPRVRASVEAAQIVFLYPKDETAFGDAINADIATMQKSGFIAGVLKSYGLDPRGADVGPLRLIK
jgi:polar amino acid transport system substrate-binding protein